jgi:hypothetical protein
LKSHNFDTDNYDIEKEYFITLIIEYNITVLTLGKLCSQYYLAVATAAVMVGLQAQ